MFVPNSGKATQVAQSSSDAVISQINSLLKPLVSFHTLASIV
jgi:hypothetical protein